MKKLVVLIFTIFLLCGCVSQNNKHSKDLYYMDTYINISIYSNNLSKINKAMAYIDKLYSDYNKLSDPYTAYDNIINLNYINNKLSLNTDTVIDKRLYDLLSYSVNYYEKSNRLFNIALGNVIDIWATYRDGIKIGVPTYEELKNSGSTDINSLLLKENNTVSKTSNIKLDLGAIAKGYVTEIAGEYLKKVGLNEYLITAGSSSVKAGDHYNNDKYKIGLTNPIKTDSIYKVLKLSNKAITTSGSYERYYEYKGVRYSHIINPNTLYPSNYMLSVTVITDDAALGEVLSTTLFLMPIKEGIKYIKSFDGIEAIWYDLDGNITSSNGMNAYE